MRGLWCVIHLALLSCCLPALAAAQGVRRSVADVSAGYAGFVDEDTVDHFTLGGGWRWQMTRRLSLGPEVVYMHGPGTDRDVFITGKLVVDLTPANRVGAYVVADGGMMLHRDEFLRGPFWVKEGAGTFGAGVRVNVTDRLSTGAEVRIGWEPHIRITGVMSWRLGP